MEEVLLEIFDKLLKSYGPRKWWPARTRFEVIVGAILVQNVSWKNAKKAIDNLKHHGLLSPEAIISVKEKTLATYIISSRFYNQKARKLKAFCKYLEKEYCGSISKMFANDTDDLRKELLSINGIGKETADSILLYAGRKLSFVSDSYTKRFIERYNLLKGELNYDIIRSFFTNNLPEDLYLYNEYHALIVHHCYSTCKSIPLCNECPVKSISSKNMCAFGSK
ncbi:MAG: endonuclease III domain-containing protein [Candidatus Omnitrophica bacterium]|nr:endonuclease III domain-containing protein [Candidatus Omnitrophota bacterium]